MSKRIWHIKVPARRLAGDLVPVFVPAQVHHISAPADHDQAYMTAWAHAIYGVPTEDTIVVTKVEVTDMT